MCTTSIWGFDRAAFRAAEEITQNVRRVLAFLRDARGPTREREIKTVDANGAAIAGGRLGAALGMLEAAGFVVSSRDARVWTYAVADPLDHRDVRVEGGRVLA